MTAITADLEQPLSLLGSKFTLKFALSLEALTSILATKGAERVKAWANADGSDAARLSAAATLLMTDTAIRMLTEYAKAKRAPATSASSDG
jgi:hypothetical protein